MGCASIVLKVIPFRDQLCTAIYRELWIHPDGEVAACVHLGNLIMGSILQDGMMTVWNGHRFRSFRKQIAKGLLPACMRCEKLSYFSPP
jgi:radical SAM protein with 4Fe4S-binding SPASM domain